jgi:hypothetical protein
MILPRATSSDENHRNKFFVDAGKVQSVKSLRIVVLVLSLLMALTAAAEEEAPAVPSASSKVAADKAEMDAIAEAMANPLSFLWLAFMQNDTIWPEGDLLDTQNENADPQNVFMLNPVLSVQLTEKWKTIFRPVIPIVSYKTLDNVNFSTDSPGNLTGINSDRESGLGDIVLWTAFSRQYTPPFVWGFGPTLMLDTATEEQLGSGKFSAGPMALGMYLSDKWILGAVAQHWWSFAGEDSISVRTNLGTIDANRPDVNLTDVQPIIRYRLSVRTSIGVAPNWRYNWETNQLDLPIGIGGDTLIKIGRLPVKIGLETYYHVVRDDDFGPEWQIRLMFVPVLPAPAWSRKPIF